jgi:hypothetical protein
MKIDAIKALLLEDRWKASRSILAKNNPLSANNLFENNLFYHRLRLLQRDSLSNQKGKINEIIQASSEVYYG